MEVEISNPTKSPLIIPPRGLICELQEVQIADDSGEVDTEETGGQQIPDTHHDKDMDTSDTGSRTDEETFISQFTGYDPSLTQEQVDQVNKLLWTYQDTFSKNDFDIGRSTIVQHRIDLTDDIPFKQRHRRIPPSMYEEVRDHLRHLLEGGIIRESNSPWASAVVLVRKKTAS